jgi:hypothetical protein
MRPANLLLHAIAAIVVIGAFFAGRHVGKQEAEQITSAGVELFTATRSAESFVIATRTREALRQPDPARAESILVRYAAIQVPTLLKCAESPDCTQWVGKLMPTKDAIKDAVDAEAALPSKK